MMANHVGDLVGSVAQGDNIQVPPGEDISERLTMVAPLTNLATGTLNNASSEDGEHVCLFVCLLVG